MKRKLHYLHEQGAEMVELAIVLPLFVGLVFVCFDLARIANGYAAVHSAAYRASRDAAALHRTEWNAVQAINFAGSPPGVNVGNEIDSTLINDATFSSPEFRTADLTITFATSAWYQCMSGAAIVPAPCINPIPGGLNSLYRMEVRALGYANQVMKENTGSSKYPCDANSPEALASASPEAYAGCFRCFTLRGDPSYNGFFSASGPGSKWLIKVLAMRCQYDVPITSTSIALGWFPTHITVSSDVFVDVDFYGNSFFYPDP